GLGEHPLHGPVGRHRSRQQRRRRADVRAEVRAEALEALESTPHIAGLLGVALRGALVGQPELLAEEPRRVADVTPRHVRGALAVGHQRFLPERHCVPSLLGRYLPGRGCHLLSAPTRGILDNAMWMKNRPLLFYAIACFVLACVSGIDMPPAGQEHVIAQGAVIFYASGAVVFMLLHRQNGARLVLLLLRLIGYKRRDAVAPLEGL